MRRRLPVELTIPVIQAPMAGGTITTPELVAAVSNAGGLGSIAGGYLSADATRRLIERVRGLTERPFAVNLFVPSARQELTGDVDAQLRVLEPIHRELGIDPPVAPVNAADAFEDQVEVAAAARVPVVSFTFGVLPASAIERLHAAGAYLMGTATTVAEARALEATGIDAVIAQGSEAGAHRGTFEVPAAPPLVGLMALVPQVCDAVGVPVIASGGMMDGRGIVAALALGASAVQMGTAFLVCDECGAPEVHKRAVLAASDESTELTRAFSGRWARGIRNRFMERSAGTEALTYPSQNTLTSPMRAASAKAGNAEYLSLWAGQGAKLARRMPAAELMNVLRREMVDAVKDVSSLPG